MEDEKVKYVLNIKETQLAKEKARQMKEGFKSWIWENIDRRKKYEEKYNNLFNAIRGREYDGSHQTVSGHEPSHKSATTSEKRCTAGKVRRKHSACTLCGSRQVI